MLYTFDINIIFEFRMMSICELLEKFLTTLRALLKVKLLDFIEHTINQGNLRVFFDLWLFLWLLRTFHHLLNQKLFI